MIRSFHIKRSILFVLVLCAVFKTNAQPVSVRISTGYAYLPLHDWSEFFGNLSNASYSKSNPNSYWLFSVHYSIKPAHIVSASIERIRTFASSTSPIVTIDWEFHGVPITLGYEYKLETFVENFSPIIGGGVSYIISKVQARDNILNTTPSREGNGYGVHVSIGLQWEIVQSLSIIPQLRYRYSDGMAFTDSNNAVKVQFTGFDFSAGIGWAL